MNYSKARLQAERILLAGFFGSLWIAQWACKRVRGDHSPVVVFTPVRGTGGPRG